MSINELVPVHLEVQILTTACEKAREGPSALSRKYDNVIIVVKCWAVNGCDLMQYLIPNS